MSYRQRRISRVKKSHKPLRLIFGAFLIIIIFLSLYRNLWIRSSEETTIVNIPYGSGINQVADILVEEEIITGPLVFKIKAKSATPIQAGTFELPSRASVGSVLSVITKPASTLRLTIPEGSSIKEIDAKLTDLGLIQSGEFIDCTRNCPLPENFPHKNFFTDQNNRNLEGFLFPNTYFLNQLSYSNENLLGMLLDEYTKQVSKIDNYTNYNLYEITIMASILEKEVRTLDDMPIVSGIFYKRLENDWALGADATSLYEKNNREITRTDLNSNSPYNTRKFRGLPPTPIGNPGIETLKAAANPIQSDYWFYITRLDTGEVIYAKDYDQHNANIDKYLR